MKENLNSPRTIIDEIFTGVVVLFISSLVIGKFISPPLGNILLVGCALYVFAGIFFGFADLFLFTFSRIDEENKKPAKKETKPELTEDSKGYLIYFAFAYIVFWVVMFLIFPEDTSIGEFIRQWKYFC